jgi:dihydropteroate synthase
MGVLNVTPDSFSDGGLFQTIDSALARVAEMVSEGADIIDIGGESTRPGSVQPSTQEELDRVLPVLEAVQTEFDCPISIDTSTPALMIEAVSRGVALINDVRALTRPGAHEAVGSEAFIVLMHMQGTPATMQEAPHYEDVVMEVSDFLIERVNALQAAGINEDRFILDPGFGFGKTRLQNMQLIRGIPVLLAKGYPVMIGLSRKSSIQQLASDVVVGSVAGALASRAAGAKIIRVHDVAATISAFNVWREIEQAD